MPSNFGFPAGKQQPAFVGAPALDQRERSRGNDYDSRSPRRRRGGDSDSEERERGGSRKMPKMREGDWECPDPKCKNINFSRRTACNRCGESKPFAKKEERRKPAAHLGGPPGLFKEGDWRCAKCGNINFSRRNTCKIKIEINNKVKG